MSPISASIISSTTYYASAAQVVPLCQNLLGGASAFTTSSSPTLASVEMWLGQAYDTINVRLSGSGIQVPIAATTSLYGQLEMLNTLYAAGMAEMSRINVILSPGERTRGQVFLEMFWKQLGELGTAGDLSAVGGGGRSDMAPLYAGGVNAADKASIDANSKFVKPRFKRDMFRFGNNGD
jgi:hypothetical protein